MALSQSQREYTQVSVAWGMSETFWDVTFSDLQKSYADAGDLPSGISVQIDAKGKIDLNHGYVETSPEGSAERSIFVEFEDAIVEALLQSVPDTPEYAAFRKDAAAETEHRHESLRELALDIARHELDLEEEDA